MAYFDKALLLEQNPPKPFDVFPLIDGIPQVYAGYSTIDSFINCIESYQHKLNDVDKFLTYVWAYGTAFKNEIFASREIYGVTLLKQLLIFIHTKVVDIRALIDDLKQFMHDNTVPCNTPTTDNGISACSTDSILLLANFKFQNQQIFDPVTSVEIIVERALTLIEKKEVLIASGTKRGFYNESQSYIDEFLNQCIIALVRHFPDINTENKFNLLHLNQRNVIQTLLMVAPTDLALSFNLFERAVKFNKSVIALDGYYPQRIETRWLVSRLKDPEESNNPYIREQIAKIGIDIIEDMSNHPVYLEIMEGKGNGATILDIIPLISKTTDNDYNERLLTALIKFASYKFIYFDYRVLAMITAYRIFNVVVDDKEELITGIKNNELKWSFKKDVFSYTELFDFSMLLDCLASNYYSSEIIDYLFVVNPTISSNPEIITKIFAAFCKYLALLCEQPFKPLLEKSIDMILSYDLSFAQKIEIYNLLYNSYIEQNNKYAKQEIITSLLTVQKVIEVDNNYLPNMISTLDYKDNGLDEWTRISLYMRQNHISVENLISTYIDCELFLKSPTISYPLDVPIDLERIFVDTLNETESCIYYDQEYIQNYPDETDDKDILEELLGLLGISINVLQATQYENMQYEGYFDDALEQQKKNEIKISQNSIQLDTFLKKRNFPTGYYQFLYQGKSYHFNSYNFENILYYIALIANEFLKHINCSRYICRIGNVQSDGGVNMVAINLEKFSKLNKFLKIPLKVIKFNG